MSLKNWLEIGQLVDHEANAAQVRGMLEAIRQNIEDARSGSVSAETRFEAAYRAITQCAMIALWANAAFGVQRPSITANMRPFCGGNARADGVHVNNNNDNGRPGMGIR
jgi:hypothetical protein